MSFAATINKTLAAKPKKEKKDKPQQPPATERLKTVVRRLPPNLPEDIFWQSVQTWVTDDTVTWKTFYAGKMGKRLNKENIPSRAYIAFKDEAQLALFSREYDGHLFRDKEGNEWQAVVEFAPYQKTPPEKKKVDNRNATIEKDEDYISFIASLQATPTNAEPISLDSLIAAAQPAPPPKTTPLLEALKAEKAARLEKERNQAAAAKKEEVKAKKILLAKPQPPPQAESSKRGSKKVQKSSAAKNAAEAGPSGSPKTPKAQHAQKTSPAPIAASASAPPFEKPASPTPAERRTRPTIRPSRHLQTALSGAVGGEVKLVQGKEKAESQDGNVKGKGRQDKAKGPPTPSILQRPTPASPPASTSATSIDPLTNPAGSASAPTPCETAAPAVTKMEAAVGGGRGARGGGGGRRGRGRGRGFFGRGPSIPRGGGPG